MTTAYIVCSKSFSYNDETYSKEEGSLPIKAFKNQNAALEHCKELDLREVMSDINSACGELYSHFEEEVYNFERSNALKHAVREISDAHNFAKQCDEFLDFVNNNCGWEVGERFGLFLKSLPDEAIMQILEALGISYYTVQQVELV